MSTTVHVVGTVATEPRIIYPSSGTPLCSFRLASDERRYDREQQTWVEGTTNWFGVVCFRSLATHAHESFSKGDRVIVSGKLRVRNWEKDEKRGTAVEVEAEAVGHDLRWGVSRFEKRSGSVATATGAQPTSSVFPQEPTEKDGQHSDNLGNADDELSTDGFTPKTVAA